jgi:hypothetical protein
VRRKALGGETPAPTVSRGALLCVNGEAYVEYAFGLAVGLPFSVPF